MNVKLKKFSIIKPNVKVEPKSFITIHSGGGGSTLIEKSIFANGTYNAADDNADGYTNVRVNVPNSYTASDEGKVVYNGALVAQTSTEITENGVVDTTTYNSVTVNVSGGAVPEEYPDLTEFYSVSHRGANTLYTTISENTVQAFAMSKKLGYEWVETDIRHTSDHVPILNHSETVDVNEITSPITISDTTWATLSSYTLAGTTNKMSSLEEGLTFCKNNGLRMYLELKDGTQSEIEADYELVDRLGMKKKVVWISTDSTLLEHIKSIDPIARLIYVVSVSSSTNIDTAASLITATNQVGLDVMYGQLPQSSFDLATAAGLTVGIWTIDSPWEVLRYYRMGVKHFTSDKLRAEKIIESLITLTADDFMVGKIEGGYINSLNTSDTTRISYVGEKIRVKSGTSYSIRAKPVSGLSKTLQVGAQIFGSSIYKKMARGEVVSAAVATDKTDSGWNSMNSGFTVKVNPGLYTSGFNNPTIMAFTLHHTDNSDIIPSELDVIEIIEIGEITNLYNNATFA